MRGQVISGANDACEASAYLKHDALALYAVTPRAPSESYGSAYRTERSADSNSYGRRQSVPAKIARDAMRTAFLEANGYRLIRFNNAQLYENIEAVIEAILDALHETE